MALTIGSWTEKTVNGFYHTTCNVAFTTSEQDAYTLKTPKGLDVTRAWTLIVASAADPEGQALPMDLWIGSDEDFVVSGDDPATATSGALWKEITSDIRLAVTTVEHVFIMDPYLSTADVVTIGTILTGYKLRIPIVPYYALAFNAATALVATNTDFTIVQPARKNQLLVNR